MRTSIADHLVDWTLEVSNGNVLNKGKICIKPVYSVIASFIMVCNLTNTLNKDTLVDLVHEKSISRFL